MPAGADAPASAAPVVGIVGGGQLARMTQQAAIGLGVSVRLLADAATDAAGLVVPATTTGDYRDVATLVRFASSCDVVTFDHEHVPTEELRHLELVGTAVRPSASALVHAQDKVAMRQRLAALGVAGPAYAVVSSDRDVAAFAEQVGWPVVLKAARGGYDGRGVWLVEDAAAAKRTLLRARVGVLLAEAHVRFRRELAVQVARSPLGQAVAYPVVETVQRDGICREVVAPAPRLDPGVAMAAQQVALRIAAELDVAGMLAVELFEVDGPVVTNGPVVANGAVLVNELAMRPHNSGHWTIEGAVTSQFEQHLRAVLDLPLGSPRMTAPYAVMVNILGGTRPSLYDGLVHVLARDPSAHVHLYGKAVRPGRKVGHVTVVGADLADLQERARHAASYLAGHGRGDAIERPPAPDERVAATGAAATRAAAPEGMSR